MSSGFARGSVVLNYLDGPSVHPRETPKTGREGRDMKSETKGEPKPRKTEAGSSEKLEPGPDSPLE